MKIEADRPDFKLEIANIMEGATYVQTEYNLTLEQALEIMKLNNQDWVVKGVTSLTEQVDVLTNELYQLREDIENCMSTFPKGSFLNVSAMVKVE